MFDHGSSRRTLRALSHALVTLSALGLAGAPAVAGTWTKLAHAAPAGVDLLLLMPDGTVMAAQNNGSTIGKGWYRLTPDSTGSYVNGTWTTLASAHDTRLYYPAEVMRDGRVFVAGGEYGTGGPQAEVYDPSTNVWTSVTPGGALWSPGPNNFYDCNSEVLPDGRVLVMPVFPKTGGVGLIFNPTNNSWSNAGPLFTGTFQDEASWVKLRDDSILTIDPFGTTTERYIAATNSWINDSVVPTTMYDPFSLELGGAVLLPDGRAFFIGGPGTTALYTPSGTTAPGTWVAGPIVPNGGGAPDAPAAMMVTGHVLCALSAKSSPGNGYPAPTFFYEYDPVDNGFTQILAPNGTNSDNISAYMSDMLCLPDGTVLYSHFNSDLYVYTPAGSPLAAGKPVISSLTQNLDGNWHLVGTGLNGISEGASYGDDLQMNSNYPLVRLTSGGNVYYARTYAWSSTGVQTGATPVSTEFSVPISVPAGSYSLVVVGNGFASDPMPFTVPTLGTWTGLGGGLAGTSGIPSLTGSGPQNAGQTVNIVLSSALPSTTGLMFVSASSTPVPFKGGTLVAFPDIGTVPIATNHLGTLPITASWPAGIPSATSFWYQDALVDPAAVKGVALSNALQSTSP